MKKNFNFFVLLISMIQYCSAQTSSEFVNVLSQDTYFNDYYWSPVAFTNSQDISITGLIEVETSVRIFSSGGMPIKIIPTEDIPTGRDILTGGNGTGIRVSTGSGGGRFSVFPNPATTIINYQSTSQNIVNYKVYNMFGILLKHQNTIPSTTGTIDVTDLIQGTYILKLTLENQQQVNLFFIKN